MMELQEKYEEVNFSINCLIGDSLTVPEQLDTIEPLIEELEDLIDLASDKIIVLENDGSYYHETKEEIKEIEQLKASLECLLIATEAVYDNLLEIA